MAAIATTTETFVEIYDIESGEATRRESIKGMTQAQIDAYAEGFAARIDRELYGVRLAEVTVTTLRQY